MVFTTDQLIEKYRKSLGTGFITGFVTGLLTMASLNMIAFTLFLNLNIFFWIMSAIGLLVSAGMAFYWNNFVEQQEKNMRKQIAKLYADKYGGNQE